MTACDALLNAFGRVFFGLLEVTLKPNSSSEHSLCHNTLLVLITTRTRSTGRYRMTKDMLGVLTRDMKVPEINVR